MASIRSGGYVQATCSKSCAKKLAGVVPPRPAKRIRLPRLIHVRFHGCPGCAARFKAGTSKAGRYCSHTCRNRHRWQQEHGDEVRSCRECGEAWRRGDRPNQIDYCSIECSRRAAKRSYKQQRRARLKNADGRVEGIRNEVVAERDHWRCHICHGEVDRETWSIDHLVPLSKGGDHSYDNVALAHWRCNVLRGAADLPPQGALIA
jgi:5-methylcytosine-specific restriction endonuclease McrA